jgi:hypothetical protein
MQLLCFCLVNINVILYMNMHTFVVLSKVSFMIYNFPFKFLN